MKKRSTAFIIIVSVILALLLVPTVFTTTGKATDHITIYLDGKQLYFEVMPETINGRTFVPVRSIFEALGAVVTWDGDQQTVIANLGDNQIILNIGKTTATRNGDLIELEAAPQVIKGTTLVPLRFISEAFGAEVKWRAESRSVYINMQISELPILGSKERLQELLEQAQVNMGGYHRLAPGMEATTDAVSDSAMKVAPAPEAETQTSSAYFSTTNIQVQGVDEADMVKTDGKYIYQVNNGRIIVGKVYPDNEMKLVKVIDLNSKTFAPKELYLDENFLVVIGTTNHYYPMPMPRDGKLSMPYYDYRNTVSATIYDISDKSNIKLVREVEIDGHYVSSRKIGSALYLIANKDINYYLLQEGGETDKPAYRDTAIINEFVEIDFDSIRYFPNSIEPNYLLVAGLDLNKPDKQVEVSTFLGSGQNIYASPQNLYVAVTQYDFSDTTGLNSRDTEVYQFALDKGSVNYKSKGKVPGSLLNQFSMDEYNGFLRVATTTGEMWRTDEHTSKNNVYVLDKSLKIAGKVEDIAPGEIIYSTRFMGNRGYMVTFRTVDPLFVIDLKDPQKPTILGALKIPGYSDYLHPYDENHLIGFGKDAVEVNDVAFDLGMKMAMFDVTDVHNPKEKFVEIIGDRGTDSELLRNHKALLFSREKNLLAFPITVMEVAKGTMYDYKGMPPYGEFAFQGAYVYQIDTENGFNLKGRITHLSDDDYLKTGQYWYDSSKNIERILYINDTLYTLSNKIWKAHGLEKLDERNSLDIPEKSPVRDTVYPTEKAEQIEPEPSAEESRDSTDTEN